MNLVPFFHRSIFDDVDSMFDDLWWDGTRMLPARVRSEGKQQRGQNWSATVQLTGYRPNEVQIERAKDNSSIKVLARREEGDDFSESRRTVQIPDSVDRDKVEVDFTREGILVIKAPYRHQQQLQQSQGQGAGGREMGPFGGFVLAPRQMSQEMRTLENEMWNLANQSFPGSMNSQIVKADDGGSKLAVDFNLSGYRPEEISVTNEGQFVTVEARHETQGEHGSSFKHFKRVFTLPENVQVDQLRSQLLRDGRLRLEAPCQFKEKEQEAITASGHDIPVKRSASKK